MRTRVWRKPADASPTGKAGAPHLLFVTDRPFLPPRDGSAAVYRETLMALAARYPVSCLIVTDAGQDIDSTASLLKPWTRSYLIVQEQRASPPWLLLRALMRSLTRAAFAPELVEQWGRRGLRAAIRKFIADSAIDVVVMSKLHSLFFTGSPILDGIAKVVDLHDDYVCRIGAEQSVTRVLCSANPSLETQPPWNRRCWRSRLSLFSRGKARRQEARLMREFDRVLVSSAEELARYRSRAPDPERFCHLPWPLARQHVDRGGRQPVFDAGFVGADTAFNLEGILYFLDEIVPLVRRQRPDFRFLVAGRIAATLRAIRPSDSAFEASESLAEMGAFYDTILIAVVPLLHGTGISIKLLEALSFRCPVVTTRVGARGLDLRHDNHLMIGATREAFADSVLALCRSAELRDRVAAGGQAWVRRHHGAEAYLEAFAGAIAPLRKPLPSTRRA